MTIRIIHESPDDYFYLRLPGSARDVYVSSERIVVGPWHLDGVRLAELRTVGMRLHRRFEFCSSYAGWASDDEGATFQVFADVPEAYLDLHDDLPAFPNADLIAGRTGFVSECSSLQGQELQQSRFADSRIPPLRQELHG